MPVAERFFLHVDKAGPAPEHRPELGPCWEWTGSLNHLGYARFFVTTAPYERESFAAHAWSWEQEHGPVPEGLELDHLCRNRRCVNPAHLEPVTHRENVLRSRGNPFTVNALKTHCVNGHLFDEANTYSYGTWRQCRACNVLKGKRSAAAYLGLAEMGLEELRAEVRRLRLENGRLKSTLGILQAALKAKTGASH